MTAKNGRKAIFVKCGQYTLQIQKFKMATTFLGKRKFLEKKRVDYLDTLGVKNFGEIPLSRTVKEIEANLCFSIFSKNSKIQNSHHFFFFLCQFSKDFTLPKKAK